MITFYIIDENKVWTGQTVEKPVFATWTDREVAIEPPVLEEGQFARWAEKEWEVLEAYPTPVVDIEAIKVRKKSEIKQAFMDASIAPIVDTGLGFSVDAAYHNKTDFETGKKYAIPQARASDNTMHDVTLSDYDTIIAAIEMHGIALYQRKWELEAQVDSATTIQELEVITW